MTADSTMAFADAAGQLYDERQFYMGRIAALGNDPVFEQEVAGYIRLVANINDALSRLALMSGARDSEFRQMAMIG